MPTPLATLKQLANVKRTAAPTQLPADPKLTIPINFKVTGKEGYFRCQWSPVDNADGYQVAVSSAQNTDVPDVGLFTLIGIKSLIYDYNVGNVALTRYFAVRSFQGFPPRFYSDFCGTVSGLSIVLTGAGSTEPASPSTVPNTLEIPPAGAGPSGRPVLK